MALALGGRMRRGRAGLRVAGRHPAARRLVAPVLPGRPGRAGQARRQRHAPTSPPACGTTGCSPTTAASSRRCGRSSSGPSTSCSTCRPPRGEILWARHADGTPWSFALLTGSSSICHSLRCAIALAEHLGHERPDWELSAARLAHVIRTRARRLRPEAPLGDGLVLPGAHRRGRRRRRAASAWPPGCDAFVDGGPRRALRVATGRGSPWPRPASARWPTSPSASATSPRELFGWAQQYREPTTAATGPAPCTPRRSHFPGGEQSTYTAAAVVLAADALAGAGPASALFVDHDAVLPSFDDADDSLGARTPIRLADPVSLALLRLAPAQRRRCPRAERWASPADISRCVVGRARPLLCVVGMANCLRGTRGTPTAGEWASTSLVTGTSVTRALRAGAWGRRPLSVTECGRRRQTRAQHPERAGRRHVREAPALERPAGRSRTAGGRRRPGPGTRRGCTAGRRGRRAASSARSRGGPARVPWPPSMNSRASGVGPVVGDRRRVADHARRPSPRGRRRGSCAGTTAACPCDPTSGSTRSGSCHSQPAWFSSEPRWWSRANSTVPASRAAAPS